MAIRTPYVVAGCLGLLVGVAWMSVGVVAGVTWPWVMGALVVSGVGVVLYTPDQLRVVGVAVFAAGIGVLHMAYAAHEVARAPSFPATTFPLEGRVRRVLSAETNQFRVRLTGAHGPESGQESAVVDLVLPPRYRGSALPGDMVRAPCRFRPARMLRERFLSAGICTVHVRDAVHVRPADRYTIARVLAQLHDAAASRMERVFPEPTSGILRSLLLGDRRTVAPELDRAFRSTGTVHVLVVSGWHMTMVALAVRRLLRALWFPRELAVGLALLAVLGMLGIAGPDPSALRGACMAAVVLAVELLGRVGNPLRALLLTTTVMVLVRPSLLAFEVGFQLSVLATAGLLVASSGERSETRTSPWRQEVVALVRASFAAAIATAPLLAWTFGTVTPLGVLANVLIVPVVPVMVLGGVLVLLAMTVIPAAVPLMVWGTDALVRGFVFLVQFFAHLPGVSTRVIVDGWFVVACYGLLAVLVWWWYRWRGIRLWMPMIADDPHAASMPPVGIG
ncbi:ComEC/Rec2 family competence protein [Candidatus Uhrbacteria bacterium]|nr:ComEC/Rec2 family competence protein [Candidatus Uhrbacteria bacterium]